jgi:hypothetical protein
MRACHPKKHRRIVLHKVVGKYREESHEKRRKANREMKEKRWKETRVVKNGEKARETA